MDFIKFGWVVILIGALLGGIGYVNYSDATSKATETRLFEASVHRLEGQSTYFESDNAFEDNVKHELELAKQFSIAAGFAIVLGFGMIFAAKPEVKPSGDAA